MGESNINSVGRLPALFYDNNGNLDLDFFEILWKETGLSIRRVKSLVKLTSNATDDRAKIRALAEHCEKPEWRRDWFRDFISKKRGVPRYIAHLAMLFSRNIDARLDIKHELFTPFFKTALDGKIYPKYEKTSELVALLNSLCDESPKATAAFTWALHERNLFASRLKGPGNNELKTFAAELMREIQLNGSSEFNSLLAVKPETEIVSVVPDDKTTEEPQSVDLSVALTGFSILQSEGFDEQLKKIQLEFEAAQFQVSKELEAIQKSLVMISGDYQSLDLLGAALVKTRVKIEDFDQLSSVVQVLASETLSSFKIRMRDLRCLTYVPDWLNFELSSVHGFIGFNAKEQIDALNKWLGLDEAYSEFSIDVIDRFKEDISVCYELPMGDALIKLGEILVQARKFNHSLLQWDSAHRYVQMFAQDPEWDATTDPLMDEHWVAVAKYCLDNYYCSNFTWLFCRKALGISFESVAEEIIRKIQGANPENWFITCRQLSFLDPAQLEKIAEESDELNAVVVLTQVFGFLVAALVEDPQKFDYWSSWPLRQYMKDSSDTSIPPFDRLISAIYSSSAEDGGLGVLDELRKIDREKVFESGSNATKYDVVARNELDSLLTYRIHGDGNYAALWKTAYKDCIEPLKRFASVSELSQCAIQLADALEEVDVDVRYFQWLRTLQHSVYSESQYEAATKVYVGGRLAKIKNWCERYSIIRPVKESLNHSIQDVLNTIDYHAERLRLQLWINEAARVLSLEKNIIPALRTDEQDLCYGIGVLAELDLPRSYLDRLSGVDSSWRKLCTDYLSKLAGSNTPDGLWEFYKSANSLEAQEHVCETFPSFLTDAEQKTLAQKVHLDSIKLAVEISDLKTRLTIFGLTNESVLILKNMELAFEAKNWTRCRIEIDSAKILVAKLDDENQVAVEREKLLNQIRQYGIEVSVAANNKDLIAQLEELVKSSAERRKHIKVLMDFSETRNLSPLLMECASEEAIRLSEPSLLPSADDSQFLAEVWESFLKPIAMQLKRPQVLQYRYKQLLELLSMHAIKAMLPIFSDLAAKQSIITACIDCAVLLEEASSADDLKDVLEKFSAETGLTALKEELEQIEISIDDLNVPTISEGLVNNSPPIDHSFSNNIGLAESTLLVYSWLTRHVSLPTEEGCTYNVQMERRDWHNGLATSYSGIRDVSLIDISTSSSERDALLAAVICALNIPSAIADVESSYAVGLVAACEDASPVQWAHNQKGKLGASIIVDVVGMIILRWANKDYTESVVGKQDFRSLVGAAIRELGNLQISGDVPRQEAVALFGNTSFTDFPPGKLLKMLWDVFTGDKQQAEVRAGLMLLLYKVGLYKHIGLCFTLPPIEIEKRVALAYAQLLENSESTQGRESLENIRGASQSKPFVTFAQAVLASLTRNTGLPAEIEFASPLEKMSSRKAWCGILTITPRPINPPLDIELELPGDGTITFGNGKKRIKFSGPFFGVREERVELFVNFPELGSTVIRVRCEFITLEEKRVTADIELTLTADAAPAFQTTSSDQLSKAFAHFPQFQMRGLEYVHRDADEKRIETALFDNDRAGSVWISSPRRSGKTTMLFRILDSYSHKVGRDNGIIFLSMDKGFQTVKEFNHWVWSRTQSNDENSELRNSIPDFARIGEKLPFDAGADIFLSALSKEIIARSEALTRVYFLLDEVDKLAEMTLSAGNAKEVADELTWQFRHIIASQPNIGMVFCGSNPARTMFVRNPKAALYNSIQNFDLTPFGTGSELEKRRSREIVEPAALRGKHKLPDKTLEFLIRVTAGIPYYMKLVAGATYAVSQQKYLMHSDVIHGLASLLSKSTGVTALDSLDDPGEDELRVLYTRDERDQLLIRAVLYSAADIRSPISGGPLMNGELRSIRSPLVGRYNISKSDINAGVESAIQLGYLKRHKELAALEFSIPMLGESIRHRSGALWAIINDKLEQLVNS